ncbi:hypothetical protein QJQ45_024308 [Haematococcus lacustris]|nr:hypothetical protein QJQ45_024308 [Haematococcus lacustris]
MKLASDTKLHSHSSRRAYGAVAHWPLSRKLLWLVCSAVIGASLYTYISDIQANAANVKIQSGKQAARAAPIWFSLTAIQHYSAAGHGIKFASPSQEDDRFVWIFTYNDQSSSYDSMMQAAVTSAIEVGHLRPFCLYSGSQTSPVYRWLADHGVILVRHTPAWADQFWQAAEPLHLQNLVHSHLYATKETMVGTFQRIDIPIIPEFRDFQYVLFSDTDVLFLSKFSLAQVPQLPPYVAMAPEMTDAFPYNAGIMLMNLPGLRATYSSLLATILSNRHGLYFPGYGPLDQGAYNQHYEESIRKHTLSKVYNAKPYQSCIPDAMLLHLHGPKPADYERFYSMGECRFGEMCRQGLAGCLCDYLLENHHGRTANPSLTSMCDILMVGRKKDP